jgi:hypothetical protein
MYILYALESSHGPSCLLVRMRSTFDLTALLTSTFVNLIAQVLMAMFNDFAISVLYMVCCLIP